MTSLWFSDTYIRRLKRRVTQYFNMSQRERNQQRIQAKDASLQVGERQSKRMLLTPSLEDCNFETVWISPAPDTKKIVMRRLFFINTDKTKFLSVGFHASSAYLPLAEFGGSKSRLSYCHRII
jgi:hypothetical protein